MKHQHQPSSINVLDGEHDWNEFLLEEALSIKFHKRLLSTGLKDLKELQLP